MSGQVFNVGIDSEKKLAEAAQNLLDLARTLAPKEAHPDSMDGPSRAFSYTASAVSLAVQAIYMADHLGGEKDRVKTKPVEMRAMLHGLAEGVGSCIGTSPSPVSWAVDCVYFKSVMESAMIRRGKDTIKRMEK